MLFAMTFGEHIGMGFILLCVFLSMLVRVGMKHPKAAGGVAKGIFGLLKR